MIRMRLSDLAIVLQGQLHGSDTVFTGISTDSRSVQAGQLFVALKGEQFDGHVHAEQALAKGAVAVLSEQSLSAMPMLKVDSTYQALGQMTAYWRARMTSCRVLALTGSSGKTTLKEMLRSIALAAYSSEQVLCTEGNLNNHIGVPLTLAQMNEHHRVAIIEAGMNHAGEIAQLTEWIKPEVAIINNAGTAHIEYLGSRAGIAMAKAEIYQGLHKQGTAVWNGDDAFASYWQAKTKHHKQICFGRERQQAPHAVQGNWQSVGLGDALSISSPKGETTVHLQVIGAHQRQNALAATAGALALGIDLPAISQGLNQFTPLAGRGQAWRMDNGATVIDDSYNANPSSMRAAIDLLAETKGSQFLVMGQMGELGAHSAALHREVLQYALAKNFTAILLFGSQFVDLATELNCPHFTTHEALTQHLTPLLSSNSTCLIKGSRTTRMEQVLHGLVPHSIQHKGSH